MTSVSARAIEIARIAASDRLRPVHPGAVAAILDARREGQGVSPIRVVERGDGFKLVFGLQRLEAARQAGDATIEAEVFGVEAYPTDDAIRLDEIRENMVRYELTKLDRAVSLSAWKAIYDASRPVAGHGGARRGAGRKSSGNPNSSGNSLPLEKADGVAPFVERFSLAAAAFLDVSERTVRLALEIADGVGPAIRARIAQHDVAQSQNDLLLLARQDEERQAKICALLLAEPPAAGSVGEAIAVIDRIPMIKLEGWQRVSSSFARMKAPEQRAFVLAHEPTIRAVLDESALAARKAG